MRGRWLWIWGVWAVPAHATAQEPLLQVVFSIPQAVLIDTNGVIRWRGYPSESVSALLGRYLAPGQ